MQKKKKDLIVKVRVTKMTKLKHLWTRDQRLQKSKTQMQVGSEAQTDKIKASLTQIET